MLKPYGQGHRSLWDVIGERREQEQRLAAPARPPADYDLNRMKIANAWLWLPNLEPAQADSGTWLGTTNGNFEHDQRLVSPSGHRYNLRRIRLPQQSPEIKTLPRALQLLQGMLAHWADFATNVDWENTKVVLFAPTGIAPSVWEKDVSEIWPFDYLPVEGFDSPSLDVDEWLPWALQNPTEASGLLCVSVDTWATEERAGPLGNDNMVGESIAVLHLQRVDHANPDDESSWTIYPAITREHSPRALQPRKSSDDLQQLAETLCEQMGIKPGDIQALIIDGHLHDRRLEQLSDYVSTQLSHLVPSEHVAGQALLAGERGKSASQMTSLALAFHAAKAQDGSVLIFDRHSPTQTQAWLLSTGKTMAQTEDEVNAQPGFNQSAGTSDS
ncbi:hypothetical protein A584_22840 [Pseudomonas syringae pv. theae ICMP 3923]|nr:hypothetical protein [Pseudomonas syringae]EPM67147.1 hypothetical protein A584_22840 [Pseudomonas syringae pv. theae ICMP 3923]KPZ32852.1 hypothetical protein AN901_200147 [Pseudomonas syringae pv. theae]MBL3872212.1 hypothetical protein [Pseudomonas syringae pv. theae]GKQ30508.1 hypothetical protein PSTH68_13335 [Pseudomonas syringae pv. theae]